MGAGDQGRVVQFVCSPSENTSEGRLNSRKLEKLNIEATDNVMTVMDSEDKVEVVTRWSDYHRRRVPIEISGH